MNSIRSYIHGKKYRNSIYAIRLNADNVSMSNGYVTQLNDVSGNNNHLTTNQRTAPTLPTIVANSINGYPAIKFSGGNNAFKETAINGLTSLSNHITIMVFKINADTDSRSMFYMRGSISYVTGGPGFNYFDKFQNSSSFRNRYDYGGLSSSISESPYVNVNLLLFINKQTLSVEFHLNNNSVIKNGSFNIYNQNLYLGNWSNHFADMELVDFGIIDTSINQLNNQEIIDLKQSFINQYNIT